MADDKKEKKPSSAQIVSSALGGTGAGVSKETAKAVILLVVFIVGLAFFILPYLIGLGSSFFGATPDPLATFLGILMAVSIIYVGGLK